VIYRCYRVVRTTVSEEQSIAVAVDRGWITWWNAWWVGESYLDETNVGGLLTEALTADVQAVLADETSRVGADAAVSTSLATVPGYKPRHSPASIALRSATLPPLLSVAAQNTYRCEHTTRGSPCRRS
jgi:hypothetical protein